MAGKSYNWGRVSLLLFFWTAQNSIVLFLYRNLKDKVHLNNCRYILMAEPDHIFVNPLPNLAHGGHPAGFPFFYIKPADNEKIIRKFYPKEKGPVTDVDPIGNSPVIIEKVKALISKLLKSCCEWSIIHFVYILYPFYLKHASTRSRLKRVLCILAHGNNSCNNHHLHYNCCYLGLTIFLFLCHDISLLMSY